MKEKIENFLGYTVDVIRDFDDNNTILGYWLDGPDFGPKGLIFKNLSEVKGYLIAIKTKGEI